MKLTNNHNLPDPLVKAFSGGCYCPSAERVGVTQLIGPPLLKYLTIKHWDQIEEDVTDRFFAVFGSAIHNVLEKSSVAPMLKCKECDHVWEHTAKKVQCPECDAFGFDKVTISTGSMTEVKLAVPRRDIMIMGKADMYDPKHKVVVDWKITSTWSAVFDHDDWEQQLNIYAWMLRKMGHKAEHILVYTLFRDWRKAEASRNPDYPQIPVMRFKFNLWSDAEVEKFIDERLDDLLVEGMPRPCSAAERWRKPTKWKLHKKGQKKAIRVMDSPEKLEEYAASKGIRIGSSYYLKEYPGQDQRCESYCAVSNFCPYKES